MFGYEYVNSRFLICVFPGGFAMLFVDEYSCAISGFVAQPEKVTVNVWLDKLSQAKVNIKLF